jgi:hypothetical protein
MTVDGVDIKYWLPSFDVEGRRSATSLREKIGGHRRSDRSGSVKPLHPKPKAVEALPLLPSTRVYTITPSRGALTLFSFHKPITDYKIMKTCLHILACPQNGQRSLISEISLSSIETRNCLSGINCSSLV